MRVLVATVFGVLLLASSAAWADCAYHTAQAKQSVAQAEGKAATVKRLPQQGG